MFKIGILSSQNPEKNQVTAINAIENFQLTGYFNSGSIQKNISSLRKFNSIEQLASNSDAVIILNPHAEQFEIFIELLKKSKHLFFERPITFSKQQASKILETVTEAGVKVQVGHQLRHNAAYVSVKNLIRHPKLINTQTLISASGQNRTEVIDSLIGDIIIALETTGSETKNIYATGVNVTGDSPDFIQAKIEFINGSVANFTGSRISTKNRHQTEFFSQNSYIKVDFLKIRSKIFTGISFSNDTNTKGTTKASSKFKIITANPENHIINELNIFNHSMVNNSEPEISIYTTFKAMQIARQILEIVTR